MSHRGHHRGGRHLVAVAVMLTFSQAGFAPTIVVDGTDCTLVDAVTAANTDTATGGCIAGSGADTIGLTRDVILTQADNHAYDHDNGLPVVESEITLEGDHLAIERDDLAPGFRLFAVAPGGNLTVKNVSLLNGDGAIVNYGTTILSNSTVSHSSSPAAVNRGGSLTFTGCDVAGNSLEGIQALGGTVHVDVSRVADNGASGIRSQGLATHLYVTESDVLDNAGVGVWATDSNVYLSNSTISGNSSHGVVCDCYYGQSTVTGSTISGNSGMGIWIFSEGSEVTTITNSTVSGNLWHGILLYLDQPSGKVKNLTVVGNGGFGFDGSTYSSGVISYSVLADNVWGDCQTFPPIGGFFNFDSDGTCPHSSPITGLSSELADNGGLTLTHELYAGSSAIDGVGFGECGLANDQRGLPRNDGACDAGSYEFQCEVRVLKESGGVVQIHFWPDSSGFDLVSGLLSDLHDDEDFSRATCLGSYPSGSIDDPQPDPPSHDAYYYLARGLASCVGAAFGDSTLEPDPRDGLAFIPCP